MRLLKIDDIKPNIIKYTLQNSVILLKIHLKGGVCNCCASIISKMNINK